MDEQDGTFRERQAVIHHAYRAELRERIGRAVQEDGVEEPLPGLHLARSSVSLQPLHSVVEPSICVIAQGSKEVLLGERRYNYDPTQYLLTTVTLPRVSQVLSASKERPYLSLRLELDPSLVSSVAVEADHTWSKQQADVSAITVSLLDDHLLEAFVRLVRLVDFPSHARVLGPLITREILYWLLIGEQGSRLRHLALQGGYAPDIVQAVRRLRQHFDQPLRIEEMAQDLGMSVSGFHHHFKALTALSPLQFQKQVRLQEARRLMLSEDLDATSAAYRVGYQDAAYFNREYKSLFGVPPMRDVQRLRGETLAFSGQ
ncbi:MAG TPA: AraC family transcriptional regulator [Ktedonobacteraceae bacterium]|nr:AraC family transcriptional regulator [Ktedonobacteraceae bacterium]